MQVLKMYKYRVELVNSGCLLDDYGKVEEIETTGVLEVGKVYDSALQMRSYKVLSIISCRLFTIQDMRIVYLD